LLHNFWAKLHEACYIRRQMSAINKNEIKDIKG